MGMSSTSEAERTLVLTLRRVLFFVCGHQVMLWERERDVKARLEVRLGRSEAN